MINNQNKLFDEVSGLGFFAVGAFAVWGAFVIFIFAVMMPVWYPVIDLFIDREAHPFLHFFTFIFYIAVTINALYYMSVAAMQKIEKFIHYIAIKF